MPVFFSDATVSNVLVVQLAYGQRVPTLEERPPHEQKCASYSFGNVFHDTSRWVLVCRSRQHLSAYSSASCSFPYCALSRLGGAIGKA
jgi:hypothetical protein